MADHFEAAGDIIQDLGYVLAHFAQGTAAYAAGAGRLVHDDGARQRLGQFGRGFFAGASSGAESSGGGVSAAAFASASAVSSSSSFSSSCSGSWLTRSDEAPKLIRFSRAIWIFSFSISSAFVTRPALAEASSAPVLSQHELLEW
jgi:hypothetical protein